MKGAVGTIMCWFGGLFAAAGLLAVLATPDISGWWLFATLVAGVISFVGYQWMEVERP